MVWLTQSPGVKEALWTEHRRWAGCARRPVSSSVFVQRQLWAGTSEHRDPGEQPANRSRAAAQEESTWGSHTEGLEGGLEGTCLWALGAVSS